MRHKDDNKRDNIFNAAIQLINDQGLSQASISKIAKLAEVSASTIYVYFENKEDMLNKLYLRVKKNMSVEVFHNHDDSISIQLAYQHAMRNYVNFVLTHQDEFLFAEQFSNSPLLHHLSRTEGAHLFQRLFNLLEKGKDELIFKQVDAGLLHMFMFNPLMQYFKEYFGGRIELEQNRIDEIIQMTWDAMKA